MRIVDASAPFYIVLNAGSGKQTAAAVRELIEQAFRRAGRRFELTLVERVEQVGAIAREAVRRACEAGGVVVAAGGDGTINTLAQAAHGRDCPFGVLPQGTFNYFPRTHGIPEDPADALALLLNGRAYPVQVGLVNDRVFLVNASLGLYPQLLQDREAYKRQYGRSRWIALWSGLLTLLRGQRQMRLRLEYGGEERRMRTLTLFVGNNRLQLEQIGIDRAPSVERGELVAIMLRPVSLAEMLWIVLRGAFGTLGDDDNVLDFGFERINVHPLRLGRRVRRVKVAFDGEVDWLGVPLEFRVAEHPLWLIKPDGPTPADRPAS